MPDTQTLALIEGLERRIAHLEILEDPVRICRLTNGIASDISQNFTLEKFTPWDNSGITLALEEPGYLWWGYQFNSRNNTATRNVSLLVQVFIDGVAQGQGLAQGHNQDRRETTALVGRSDNILAVGARTADVRIWVFNAGDTVQCEKLTGYAFYTRA